MKRPATGDQVTIKQPAGLLNVAERSAITHFYADYSVPVLTTPAAIELYVCDGGCFGSPLLADDPFLSRERWPAPAGLAAGTPTVAAALAPFAARPGIRLDADMAKAIQKLARLDAVRRELPGKDCGACGAPTCAALAEDVVLERADVTLCPYRSTDGG